MDSLPSSGALTDHYTQSSDGSTMMVQTGPSSDGFAAAAAGVDFNYTYDFDSILRGRDMSTGTGQFCNVVDTLNPQGQHFSYLRLKLFKGGSQVGPTVLVDTPGTGWCFGGQENGATYHYNYEHDHGDFGFYINGTGHSYG